MGDKSVLEKAVILSKVTPTSETLIYPATRSDCVIDFDDRVPAVVDSIASPTSRSPVDILDLSTGTVNDTVYSALLT